MVLTKHKCDHIVAFHIGHCEIRKSEATKEILSDTCCGGIKRLNFCPDCGIINADTPEEARRMLK